MPKKRVRLCVLAILGVVAIGSAAIFRGRILAWPELHEDDLLGPPAFSFAPILKDMWDRPVDQGDYRAYGGRDGHLDVDSDRPFVPGAWFASRTPRATVEGLLADCVRQRGSSRYDAAFEEQLRLLVTLEQPGDVYWRFRSPDYTWRQLCGRAGIALVRSGKAVAGVVTAMN